MPRKIATQVVQTVSRQLEAGLIKQPPVWYEAVINHPPMTVPPRQLVARPDADLPRSLKSGGKQVSSWLGDRPSTLARNRDPMNSKKKAKSLAPDLRPKPIVYDQDKIRQQFFRDHPWEAYRPTTLVEMGAELPTESRIHGDPKRLRSYGRNPSVEDFVACTMAAHKTGALSLSQAYHNTLSAYHGLKAEHEHASRYAVLEATYYGAGLGKSETQRGFEKEERALESWAAWAAGGLEATAAGAVAVTGSKPSGSRRRVNRVKRTDDTYTMGQSYLDAATAFQAGQVTRDRLAHGKPAEGTVDAAIAHVSGASTTSSDDYMGLAQSDSGSNEASSKPHTSRAADTRR